MQRTAQRVPAARRRVELTEEAARRFHRQGFRRVALADVATAVGVTAPAVYRHFRNKKALLAGAIDSGLDTVDAAMAGAGGSLEELLGPLADAALRRRDLWVLLQREMRHLDDEDRVRLQKRFGRVVSGVSRGIRDERPGIGNGERRLVVTAVLATLSSPSVTRVPAARAPYRRVLAAAALAAARATLPVSTRGAARIPAPARDTATRPRGEELLQTAIELFHDRGYAAVSLDDIADALGLAGPSIYHHFATKSQLLETAFHRAAHGLSAQRADGTLEDLVRGYIDVGVAQRHLFGVYVTEAVNLPPAAARRIRAELAANVTEWAAALRARRPELSEQQSLILVHAARGVVNDVVRVGGLHARRDVRRELEALLHAVLAADLGR